VEVVKQERRGNALVLTIDRPEAGNSLSAEVSQAFLDILDEIEGDTSLRAIIITGAGDRFFCTGGDVKRYAQLTTKDELREVMRLARTVFRRFETLNVPVIAAVNGLAIGGGQHDNRHLLTRATHQPAELAAIHVRQPDIQQNQIKAVVFGDLERFGTGAAFLDIELLVKMELFGE